MNPELNQRTGIIVIERRDCQGPVPLEGGQVVRGYTGPALRRGRIVGTGSIGVCYLDPLPEARPAQLTIQGNLIIWFYDACMVYGKNNILSIKCLGERNAK